MPCAYSKSEKTKSPLLHSLSTRPPLYIIVISVFCFTIGVAGITGNRHLRFLSAASRRTLSDLSITPRGLESSGMETERLLIGRSFSDSSEYRPASTPVTFVKLFDPLGFLLIPMSFSMKHINFDLIKRLEQATGLAFRFVIGRSKDAKKMADLAKEVEKYKDFMLIDVEEEYLKLPYKTQELAYFKAAFELFDADYYVKADDDIYLRPDRLATLLAKERTHSQTYIGCMKKGPDVYGMRLFSNEDVTIGSWMLSMNVHHEDNRALCEPRCMHASIAVWDIPKCSGLCNPATRLKELHEINMGFQKSNFAS
ncbi:Glycosyl transferase, family 31 [Dillenia turbinata]|uniref:Hexosyltransferase n=1 Tax=Dillenia turbinata TaxID=194707 RepID=A0AAN8UCA9_9MAGN